ncbi:hypothetical protein P8C59_009002 [Phyllachora maydis]|uniref:N-acetyltransferase domain-containing protein n=1 Tax=Phyllachora maydis TaxID=1825666 RepID=A0AAD9IBR3_9PEZI|nr:hypothetical protein P8C59_009002 [Phyllachora maydis]
MSSSTAPPGPGSSSSSSSSSSSAPAASKSVFRLNFDKEAWESATTMPWLYFRVLLPARPLPPAAARHYTTARLVVRPLRAATDLDAFAALRARPETQDPSPTRGRVDRDRAESAAFLDRLAADDEGHWYFGAFLRASGQLVGEGGIPNLVEMGRAGWPEAEFLLAREFWRQGLGSEFWEAVVGAWWELPRALQRHQLFPPIVPDKEPGDELEEIIGFMHESHNKAAEAFLAKMLRGSRLSQQAGSLVTFDMREGREGNIVNWAGRVSENLRQPRIVQEDEGESPTAEDP